MITLWKTVIQFAPSLLLKVSSWYKTFSFVDEVDFIPLVLKLAGTDVRKRYAEELPQSSHYNKS